MAFKANNTSWTIDKCVRSALMDKGEDLSRYDQFLHWGLQAAKEWHFDMAQEVKTVLLTMKDTKAIDLPDDYVDWVKVGIKCGNIIKTFVHDEKLALHNECVNGVEIPNDQCADFSLFDLDVSSDVGYAFWNYSNLNGDEYQLFGLAYQSNGLGYFREHRAEQEIQFRAVIPANSKIILEYISDGWNPEKITYINGYASQLISLYIHWMDAKFHKNTPRSHVQEAKNDYFEEYERVGWRMFDLTVEDVLEVSREAFRQTVKS